jgi:acyl carrier protein
MTDNDVISLIRDALTHVAPNRSGEFRGIQINQTVESLQLDSITTMEMVGFLEEKVDSVFPDEELAKVNALSDLGDLIRGNRVGAA